MRKNQNYRDQFIQLSLKSFDFLIMFFEQCLFWKDSVPTPPRPSFFKNNTSSPTYVALNSPKMSSGGVTGVPPPGGVPPPPPPPPSFKPSQQLQRPVPLPALPDVLRPSEDQGQQPPQHSTFFQSRGDYIKNKNQWHFVVFDHEKALEWPINYILIWQTDLKE